MKYTVAAIALLTSASAASAIDLPIPGLALNTDVVAEYKVDAATTALTASPELEYTPSFIAGASLTAGLEVDIWDNDGGFTLADQFDVAPEVFLGATYVPGALTNLELEVGTSYDFEAQERSEIVMTATFSF